MKQIIFLLLISVGAYAQTPQTSYVAPTISAMKSYFGQANRIHVVANNTDYIICSPCTTNEITVYAGAGGRKWKKQVTSNIPIDSVAGLRDSLNSVTEIPIDATPTDASTNPVTSNGTFDALATKQPLDTDLTTLGGLTPTTDNFIYSVGGAWASRTVAQVKTTLALNNVDNTSNATERIATATLQNKTISGANNTFSNIPASALPSSGTSAAGIITANQYNRLFTRQALANPTGTITFDVNSGAQAGITFTATGGRTLAFSNLATGDLVKLAFDNTSGSTVVLTLPSNGFVAGTGSSVSVTIPTGKSVLSLVDYNGTNYYFSLQSY